jgi:hypothetical protein
LMLMLLNAAVMVTRSPFLTALGAVSKSALNRRCSHGAGGTSPGFLCEYHAVE